MQKPTPWSRPSAACRIDIRPSRACAACLAVLGVLGALSWGLSDAPIPVALAAGAFWIATATGLALRELRRPVERLVLGAERRGELDGRPVADLHVDWRGPLYVVAWREGDRRRRWFAFPDVLGRDARRGLRLWAPATRERGDTAAVAP